MPINNMGKPENCPEVTVLICTLNEEGNLHHVLPNIPNWVDEILLIDGNSTDNTVGIVQNINPRIRVLLQPDTGKGNAIRYGIQHARGEIIVMLDADGSTDPSQINDFITPLLNGYEFAKGSRFLGQSPVLSRFRLLGNKLFILMTNILYGAKYTDLCAGLNAFWIKVIEEIDPQGTSALWEPTINIKLKKHKIKVVEVLQRDNGRINGTCEAGPLRQGLRILRIIIEERFRG
ncbi:glycosyltransferase family 2 protein [Chloroflexota bacterium]